LEFSGEGHKPGGRKRKKKTKDPPKNIGGDAPGGGVWVGTEHKYRVGRGQLGPKSKQTSRGGIEVLDTTSGAPGRTPRIEKK